MADSKELCRTPGQEPFHRDGAKYVCSVCGQKYFTQDDVKNCFESHPEKEEATMV